MGKKTENPLEGFVKFASDRVSNMDVNALKEKASDASIMLVGKACEATDALSGKANEWKEQAKASKDELVEKLTELDRMLESYVTEYNDTYTLMNDKGVSLFVERSRAVDSISNIECLVNSIANRPKSFDSDFKEISTNREKFTEICDFADRELQAAREAAGSAGSGLAAGAAVAFMAPTAAMWVATTFGTASTGVAISTLSGAAAESAALAWLGGGALATGGGGIAAGNALLALSGPIGWTIAGATLLSSIVIFTNKRTKINKQKNEEIEAVKENIERIKEMDTQINSILMETIKMRECVNDCFKDCMQFYGGDYASLSDEDKLKLGALVNHTKALSVYFEKTVD